MVTFKKIKQTVTGKLLVEGECISTDSKPIDIMANGSKLFEIDTGSWYFFNESGAEWVKSVRGGTGNITVDELIATENGTYTPEDEQHAFGPVIVNVPNSYTDQDEGKAVSGGELVSQTSIMYDTNGTYDTTYNNEVIIDVQGSTDPSAVHVNGRNHAEIPVPAFASLRPALIPYMPIYMPNGDLEDTQSKICMLFGTLTIRVYAVTETEETTDVTLVHEFLGIFDGATDTDSAGRMCFPIKNMDESLNDDIEYSAIFCLYPQGTDRAGTVALKSATITITGEEATYSMDDIEYWRDVSGRVEPDVSSILLVWDATLFMNNSGD